jgi:uncharacterized protein
MEQNGMKKQGSRNRFLERYGPWALVAGASEGLGAAYARGLAERGMHLVLAARRREPLETLAAEIRSRYGTEVRTVAGDLADDEYRGRLCGETKDLDLGVLVYNAAHAPTGPLATLDPADISRALAVNTQGPAALLRSLLPAMLSRGRGAVVLMSSLAGNQGTPRIATYAATKAFNRVLAEGLWHELRGRGIDVLACCAGAVRTPGYSAASVREAPGTMDPRAVAEYALRRLGHGPVAVPGALNRFAALLMTRLLPRRVAIGIMAGSTADLETSTTMEKKQ